MSAERFSRRLCVPIRFGIYVKNKSFVIIG
jgi:hypothetical protein